ncbi:hypothetical protein GY45DRAFT_551147 [Cubamyces sp. BRFM 1775]|nr:hypothetical protein GY45DRAFT_551147 [Cubamyces sp. BRFM 1775]
MVQLLTSFLVTAFHGVETVRRYTPVRGWDTLHTVRIDGEQLVPPPLSDILVIVPNKDVWGESRREHGRVRCVLGVCAPYVHRASPPIRMTYGR